MKRVFIILLSFICLMSVITCSKEKKSESNNGNHSSKEIESNVSSENSIEEKSDLPKNSSTESASVGNNAGNVSSITEQTGKKVIAEQYRGYFVQGSLSDPVGHNEFEINDTYIRYFYVNHNTGKIEDDVVMFSGVWTEGAMLLDQAGQLAGYFPDVNNFILGDPSNASNPRK